MEYFDFQFNIDTYAHVYTASIHLSCRYHYYSFLKENVKHVQIIYYLDLYDYYIIRCIGSYLQSSSIWMSLEGLYEVRITGHISDGLSLLLRCFCVIHLYDSRENLKTHIIHELVSKLRRITGKLSILKEHE